MEIELAENCTSRQKSQDVSSRRKFSEDEAVLARFGKRQQLRVSTSARVLMHRLLSPSQAYMKCPLAEYGL